MEEEEFENTVNQCDKECENEADYIPCLSRCLNSRGFSDEEVKKAIKYIAKRELERLKALFSS